MNFASWSFLGLFLPAILLGFFLIGASRAGKARQAFLIAASLLFYGISGLSNLALLLVSIAFNFSAAAMLAAPGGAQPVRCAAMWGAVLANLAALVSYKILALGDEAVDGFLSGPDILIPLALSFITFQQIGFLVSTYRRRIAPDLFTYLFFIAFFPQLILGPIVQYKQVADQLDAGALSRTTAEDVAVGLSITLFGLAQKVLLADQIALPVNRVFDGVVAGADPALLDSWFAIIGFQFQLFLDFSSYAVMAIGLARMFGIALPINFDEPLKAVNRFDLWRRWHITFVIFMRTHVFMPLVRHWKLPATVAILVTALLSGLWHGLGWTFILWGLVQAVMLLAIHWRSQRRRQPYPSGALALSWAIASTFLISCLIGTLFRSPTLETAGAMYRALGGFAQHGLSTLGTRDFLVLAAAAFLIWGLPSPARFFGAFWNGVDPRPDTPHSPPGELIRLRFALTPAWAIALALILTLSLLYLGETQRFIYAQF